MQTLVTCLTDLAKVITARKFTGHSTWSVLLPLLHHHSFVSTHSPGIDELHCEPNLYRALILVSSVLSIGYMFSLSFWQKWHFCMACPSVSGPCLKLTILTLKAFLLPSVAGTENLVRRFTGSQKCNTFYWTKKGISAQAAGSILQQQASPAPNTPVIVPSLFVCWVSLVATSRTQVSSAVKLVDIQNRSQILRGQWYCSKCASQTR